MCLIKTNQHRTQCLKSSVCCCSSRIRIPYCYNSQIFNFAISRTLIQNYKTFSIDLFWSQMIKIYYEHIFIRPSEQQVKPGRGALGSQRWDLQIREGWSKIKLKKCVQSFYNYWGDCKRIEVAGIPTVFKKSVVLSIFQRGENEYQYITTQFLWSIDNGSLASMSMFVACL